MGVDEVPPTLLALRRRLYFLSYDDITGGGRHMSNVEWHFLHHVILRNESALAACAPEWPPHLTATFPRKYKAFQRDQPRHAMARVRYLCSASPCGFLSSWIAWLLHGNIDGAPEATADSTRSLFATCLDPSLWNIVHYTAVLGTPEQLRLVLHRAVLVNPPWLVFSNWCPLGGLLQCASRSTNQASSPESMVREVLRSLDTASISNVSLRPLVLDRKFVSLELRSFQTPLDHCLRQGHGATITALLLDAGASAHSTRVSHLRGAPAVQRTLDVCFVMAGLRDRPLLLTYQLLMAQISSGRMCGAFLGLLPVELLEAIFHMVAAGRPCQLGAGQLPPRANTIEASLRVYEESGSMLLLPAV